MKRTIVALTILLVCFTTSQAQQSVQKADPQKLDISATLSNAGKALNILEDQKLKIQIKHQLPGAFAFTKDDARTELESVRDLLGSADELSLKVMNGCGYLGGATNQTVLDSAMKTQTDVWRNVKSRNWFEYFKNETNIVGSILLASAPVLASNGLVDKGYTQIAATIGGIFILVTPVSQLFSAKEDAPAQIMKSVELSDNVFFRESMINKSRDKANELQVRLNWADKQSSSLKANIQSRLDQVIPPAGSVPDPLYQKQDVVTLTDSLLLFLNEYKEVATIIGQSTAELINTIDQYNISYPEFKDRFVTARAVATDLNNNFRMIQEHHLSPLGDITDKLSRWKLLSSR